MNGTTVLVLLAGLVLGAVLGALWARGRGAADLARTTAERDAAQDRLVELTGRRDELTGPAVVKDSLDRLHEQLRRLERNGAAWQSQLRQQVDDVRLSGEALRRETAALSTALRKPQVRGRWGELHLRRTVELAGMVKHCDFTEQTTTVAEDGVLRPDLVVKLAEGKHLVVDSKVPLAAFLEAAETDDEEYRTARLRAHARQLRTHVDQLAAKAYWARLESTPEFVVLFVPGESFLSAALDVEPSLLEYAAERKVVLATPTTLIATMGEHLGRMGRSLTSAVDAYNRTVGSFESRVFTTARRLRDLHVTQSELAAMEAIEASVRPLTAPELLAADETPDTRRWSAG